MFVEAFLNEFIMNKGGKFINISSICYVGSRTSKLFCDKIRYYWFSKALAKSTVIKIYIAML